MRHFAKDQLCLTKRDKVVLVIDTLLLAVLCVVFLYPLLYVVFSSFSANAYQLQGLRLIPEKWSIEGYRVVVEYKDIWIGYRNSIFYCIAGGIISMFITICAAYPLSKKDLDGKGVILALMMFTMYFGGGLIPTYHLMRDLHLTNTVWAILLPGAMSVYNMLVMRTYFMNSVPEELHEAAELDGCGHIRYLITILLPLSVPVLAVIALWNAVGDWNAYFNALIYLRKREFYPLQLILREILISNQTTDILSLDPEEMLLLEQRQNLMRYSLIVIASVPMLVLYPFVQKYFTRGIMLGAVKG